MRRRLTVAFHFPDGLCLYVPESLIRRLTKGRPLDASGNWHFTREELVEALRVENTKGMRKHVDLCSRETCLKVLAQLESVPQTADEIAKATGCSPTIVRWVMRRYSIRHTDDHPRLYYIKKPLSDPHEEGAS